MTQHGRPGRTRRRRRRTVTFLVLASVVGVGAWQAWGPASRALGLEALGLEGLGTPALRSDPPTPSPAPTALDPDLAQRFADAQAAAAAEGVTLTLTSGWRSADEQQRLVDDAIATYGSAEEAHRWVLPPERSAHVAGLAIDVGPVDGARWLEERAGQFGLCRTYQNEWWHFESAPPDGACPEPHVDSSWGWQ